MKLSKTTKSNIALSVGIVIMILLFMSSSTPYQQQTSVPLLKKLLSSKPFYKELEQISFSYAGSRVSIQEIGYFKFIEFFIRKGAHFLSYFMMAFSYNYALHYKMKDKWLAIFITALICIGYATFDEFHQSLTPNRTPLLADVILNTSGALTGITLFKFKLLLKV